MITQKPLTSTRNYFGPRADRLSMGLPIDSGEGSSLTDVGLGYPVRSPLGGDLIFVPEIFKNGVLSDSAWLSSNEGSYLNLDVYDE